MESNPLIDQLPPHLKQFIKDQPYSDYSAIDQAVWRYVMRLNVNYLKTVAHESYIDGLKKTGLEVDNIAHMYGMNRILKEIGWAAVAVDGFIPPSAFMEFQAYNVLVIAADIRQLKHIEYTPAPDIIHEAAGHAPIIADPEYAEYLRYFGEIGCKALSSAKDYELYEAIRHLSIIKEYPFTPQESIDEAEKVIENIQLNMGEPSEMALIRRLHWWTVEYGLIGTLENPKIYGAGLLSSIGESSSCMKDDVKKIPFTLDAMNVEFDITKPQPHLFVTPSFKHLTNVLDQFADTMALRKGGTYGIQKAIQSNNLATVVLSSGFQISGTFNFVASDNSEQPAYFTTNSPTALACNDRQWFDQGKSQYRNGFIGIVGNPIGIEGLLEHYSISKLAEIGLIEGKETELNWNSGVNLKGIVSSFRRALNGNLLLIKFENTIVTYKDNVLYEGDSFQLSVGHKVVSVYSGAADKIAFHDFAKIPAEHTFRVIVDKSLKRLQDLYAEIREIRNGKRGIEKLESVFLNLKMNYQDDWLLVLEIYELCVEKNQSNNFIAEVYNSLQDISKRNPQLSKLIENGLRLVDNKSLVTTA
jgi:phenylalanine-4-hydroxylase